MQQPGPMFPVMPTFPHTSITTDQIQKYLDENKQLILAILDNQNLGKLAECARYQVQLQKNLMYLAAIADAQPQTPTIPTQLTPRPVTQQGGFYMQHPQAAAMAQQQPPILSPGAPFTNPRPLQAPPMHLGPLQMPLRSPHNDRSLGGNNSIPKPNSGPTDKPDGVANANSDGRRNRNSSVGQGGLDGVEES